MVGQLLLAPQRFRRRQQRGQRLVAFEQEGDALGVAGEFRRLAAGGILARADDLVVGPAERLGRLYQSRRHRDLVVAARTTADRPPGPRP